MKNIRKENQKVRDLMQYYLSENSLLLAMFAAADTEKDRRDILHDIGKNNNFIYELSRDLVLA